MPTKIVRFARIKRDRSRHYAGHYPLPSIEKEDVVRFITMTLDVTLRLDPEVSKKFVDGPEVLRVTPDESPELKALDEVLLPYHFGVSNITVEAIDLDDNKLLNYFGEIDPCPPWPYDGPGKLSY